MLDKQTRPTDAYQKCNFKFPSAEKRTLQKYFNFLKMLLKTIPVQFLIC